MRERERNQPCVFEKERANSLRHLRQDNLVSTGIARRVRACVTTARVRVRARVRACVRACVRPTNPLHDPRRRPQDSGAAGGPRNELLERKLALQRQLEELEAEIGPRAPRSAPHTD
jgi:hypothetical protein